jgi:hypothetical protein
MEGINGGEDVKVDEVGEESGGKLKGAAARERGVLES